MAVYKNTEEGITVVYFHNKRTNRVFIIDVWLSSKWKYKDKAEKRKRLIRNTYHIIKAKLGILPYVEIGDMFSNREIHGPLSKRLHDART